MSTKATKKKTTKTATTKRTTQWNDYFMAAMTGLTTGLPYEYGTDAIEMTEWAAVVVKKAEKIADIAAARNG